MIKETYATTKKETTLTITNNEITAVQKSNTTKTGIRLYNNGYIGIAGAIGAYDETKLIDHAKTKLTFKIPYNCDPTHATKRTEDFASDFTLTVPEFVQKTETLLARLKSEYPNFNFNHKIALQEVEIKLINDLSTDFTYRDKTVQVVLLIKHKKSKNLADSYGLYLSREFDLDAAFKAITESCAIYDEKVTVPDGKMPVVLLLSPEMLLEKFYGDLNGRAMGTGASMFAGKIGKKLFADNFTLLVDHDPLEYGCFFDSEGTVLPNNKIALIENGILKSPFSCKKIAKQYGYTPTGSAGGDYDSVPAISTEGINIKSSGKTLNELLDNRKAIYVVMASGGDFTAQGEYASPIQAAFLMENGKLTGRLPQLSMSSHIYDMFGADFIGRATDSNVPNSPFKYLALNMDVSTIGDWL